MTISDPNIDALTEADVIAAKERAAIARETREGLSTIDYVLSSVNGTTRTLAMAKRYLLAKGAAR